MKKIKYLIFLFSLITTIGLAYTVFTFKNIPELFDFDLEEDEQ